MASSLNVIARLEIPKKKKNEPFLNIRDYNKKKWKDDIRKDRGWISRIKEKLIAGATGFCILPKSVFTVNITKGFEFSQQVLHYR